MVDIKSADLGVYVLHICVGDLLILEIHIQIDCVEALSAQLYEEERFLRNIE